MSSSTWYVDHPLTDTPARKRILSSTASSDLDATLRMSENSPNTSPPTASGISRPTRPPNLFKDSKASIGGDSICVPPVLLSPVLSRPIRSHSTTSSPLPIRHQFQGSDSESDHGIHWRSGGISRRSLASSLASACSAGGKETSRPNTPTMSPIMNRSASGSRLAAAFQSFRSGSGSGLLAGRASLSRAESMTDPDRQRKKRNRRRTMAHGMCSESSVDSTWSSSSSNLARIRSCLGHSDPQISANSVLMPSTPRSTCLMNSLDRRRTRRCSLPLLTMSLSMGQQNVAPAGFSPASSRPISSLRLQAPRYSICGGIDEGPLYVPSQVSPNNRRRSPSKSRRVGLDHGHFSPPIKSSSSFFDDVSVGEMVMRPRSLTASVVVMKDVQSLSQTSRSGNPRRSLNASTSPLMGPRCRSPARAQPPSRITAPVGVHLRSYSTRSGSSLMAPQHDNRRWSLASLPSTSGYGTPGSNSAFSSQYSSSEQLNEMLECMRLAGAGRFDSNDSGPMEEGQASSSNSFRPRSRSLTSPVKFGNDPDVVNRNSVYKDRFPKAKMEMEKRLLAFINENAPLSGGASGDMDVQEIKNNRRSMVMEAEKCADKALLRLLGDGATRFLHHQIVEVASDCLSRSIDDSITCSYFCEMSQRMDETLNEAQVKTSQESYAYLSKLVKQLLMVVSRPARLLECLEFDPDEFYHLLEEAEGVVREQLGSGTARVPDLPQYIIGKLGLDRDPLLEAEAQPDSPPPTTSSKDDDRKHSSSRYQWDEKKPPCEEDFETIRLVSNGAYGAVYLVRHRETRQRFALKKMNKQTLLLRNQIDQVFAERDILTMTDNPFVVSFYGSFETRQFLCMLMEYVEGGDCAALLKHAGVLPPDLARLYVAETLLAVEYLHSYGIVHRDLKPDNLLITAMGHIKLTDFGLSKIGLMSRTTLVAEGVDIAEIQQFKDKQLCGTPEYIAPEVIIRQGYGKPVDFWALGIILYEFLIGIVPFGGDTPEDLFGNVIAEEPEFPQEEGECILPEAEDLIRRLLEKNPNMRLGGILGAPEVMMHPFFNGLDFTSLLREKAEFVPQLDNEEDTSYFDTRSDRYNHDADSCGEDEAAAPMFHSFSTASPRHSIISMDPAHFSNNSVQNTVSPMAEQHSWRQMSATQSSEDHANDSADFSGESQISSADLLRRRFSAQRQTNLSTSSSGTTGTGCMNTACSSTDSSMDASHISTIVIPDATVPKSSLPRVAISCDPDELHDAHRVGKELSPVDETVRFRSNSTSNAPSPLKLVIPPNTSSSSGVSCPSSSASAAKDTCYVMSQSQLSPGAGSVSSASSIDSSPNPHSLEPQVSPAPPAYLLKPPVTIRKGPMGFGFTLKSVRVYLAENSEYYTIEHIITAVVDGSPAFEAGLRPDDLVIQVNGQPVHNLTHPELMHRLLSFGNELTLKVTPLATTTIKEGAARKSVGKMAKKKPKRPQRRVPLEKKPRKPSSLLRRLSGKRATNDIVPGSSSQKQTFIPRSVSSQDGNMSSAPCPTSTQSTNHAALNANTCHKRMSDVGIRDDNRSPLASSRPSSLRGLKQVTNIATTPIPVSPLARTEANQAEIPPRSPSPSRVATAGRSLMSRLLNKDH